MKEKNVLMILVAGLLTFAGKCEVNVTLQVHFRFVTLKDYYEINNYFFFYLSQELW